MHSSPGPAGRSYARTSRLLFVLTFASISAVSITGCGPSATPAASATEYKLYARDQVEASRTAFLAADYAVAEKAAREAIGEEPEWSLPRELLARALAKQGRSEDAEKALRDAMAAQPDAPTPRYLLGLLLELRGDTAAANALYREARERYDADPGDAETGIERAVVEYLSRGRLAGLAAMQALRERFPGNPRIGMIEAQIRERQRDLFLTDMRAAADAPAPPQPEEE